MKTLAEYWASTILLSAKKHLKKYVSGPVKYRDFRETGPLGSFVRKPIDANPRSKIYRGFHLPR